MINNCHNAGKILCESTGNAKAGGIVAFLTRSDLFTKCSNEGDVEAISSLGVGVTEDAQDTLGQVSAGGIIAFNATDAPMSTTTFCLNTGNITARMTTANVEAQIYAGGIGGRLHEQTMSDCYNTGKITANNSTGNNGYAAGVVGRSSVHSSTRRCYNTGEVNGFIKGGIVGLAVEGSVSRDNYMKERSADSGIGKGKGETITLSIDEMKLESSYKYFNFTSTWGFKQGVNDGYPVLQAFYPCRNLGFCCRRKRSDFGSVKM